MSGELVPISLIGERLKEERTRLNLSVGEFASFTGVSDRSQRNYEGGERLPDAGYLARAKGIHVDVVYVLTGERSALKNEAEEIEKQSDQVQTVVRLFEEALQARGKTLDPPQKADCIRWIYRCAAWGAPVNTAFIDEFLAMLDF